MPADAGQHVDEFGALASRRSRSSAVYRLSHLTASRSYRSGSSSRIRNTRLSASAGRRGGGWPTGREGALKPGIVVALRRHGEHMFPHTICARLLNVSIEPVHSARTTEMEGTTWGFMTVNGRSRVPAARTWRDAP